MTIDENTRLDLRQWFEDHMGERLARAMMEAMPPIDHDQLATKADLDLLGRELGDKMAELRADLRGEMRGGLADVRMELAHTTRLLVTMQVMTTAATIASVVGLATFLGT